jgi:oligopeptide transport system substrate-binding protein
VGSTGRALTLIALLGALVAGCTTPAPEPPQTTPTTPAEPSPDDPASPERPEGGTLRVGLGTDPASIDPRFVADEEGELVVGAVFDPLVTLGDRLQVVPSAAESWETDDEGRVFTFELREATFHDGSPVTADDFVRTFARIADGTASPPSFLAYLLEPIEGAAAAAEGGELTGVEATGPSTLEIRLDAPQPGFLRTLANPSLVPLPPVADEDPEAFAQQPIGNGPFAMAGPREPDAFLRLSRFVDHHEPARLDEVLLQVYADDPSREQQWQDFVDGQLQVADVPPEQLDEARETFGASRDGYTGPGVLDGITSTVYLYGFDTTRPPFDDARVRRAISLAIDRDTLADDVMRGTRVAATAIVPPPIPGSQAGACEHCRYDPEAAREQLDAVRAGLAESDDPDEPAGADEPGEGQEAIVLDSLQLTHNRGRTHTAIAEAMASDLEDALGLEVVLRAQDLQPFVQGVRRGEASLFRLGWETGEPDPGAYLYPLFHSSQVGLDNLTRFDDPEVDELLDEARAAPQDRAARSSYAEAERRILDEAPVIPLLWYRHTKAVAPEVRDLRWSPLGRVDLSRVWFETP